MNKEMAFLQVIGGGDGAGVLRLLQYPNVRSVDLVDIDLRLCFLLWQ